MAHSIHGDHSGDYSQHYPFPVGITVITNNLVFLFYHSLMLSDCYILSDNGHLHLISRVNF